MKIARFTEGGQHPPGHRRRDTDEIIDVGTADPSLPTDLGALLATGGIGVRRLALPPPHLGWR